MNFTSFFDDVQKNENAALILESFIEWNWFCIMFDGIKWPQAKLNDWWFHQMNFKFRKSQREIQKNTKSCFALISTTKRDWFGLVLSRCRRKAKTKRPWSEFRFVLRSIVVCLIVLCVQLAFYGFKSQIKEENNDCKWHQHQRVMYEFAQKSHRKSEMINANGWCHQREKCFKKLNNVIITDLAHWRCATDIKSCLLLFEKQINEIHKQFHLELAFLSSFLR